MGEQEIYQEYLTKGGKQPFEEWYGLAELMDNDDILAMEQDGTEKKKSTQSQPQATSVPISNDLELNPAQETAIQQVQAENSTALDSIGTVGSTESVSTQDNTGNVDLSQANAPQGNFSGYGVDMPNTEEIDFNNQNQNLTVRVPKLSTRFDMPKFENPTEARRYPQQTRVEELAGGYPKQATQKNQTQKNQTQKSNSNFKFSLGLDNPFNYDDSEELLDKLAGKPELPPIQPDFYLTPLTEEEKLEAAKRRTAEAQARADQKTNEFIDQYANKDKMELYNPVDLGIEYTTFVTDPKDVKESNNNLLQAEKKGAVSITKSSDGSYVADKKTGNYKYTIIDEGYKDIFNTKIAQDNLKIAQKNMDANRYNLGNTDNNPPTTEGVDYLNGLYNKYGKLFSEEEVRAFSTKEGRRETEINLEVEKRLKENPNQDRASLYTQISNERKPLDSNTKLAIGKKYANELFAEGLAISAGNANYGFGTDGSSVADDEKDEFEFYSDVFSKRRNVEDFGEFMNEIGKDIFDSSWVKNKNSKKSQRARKEIFESFLNWKSQNDILDYELSNRAFEDASSKAFQYAEKKDWENFRKESEKAGEFYRQNESAGEKLLIAKEGHKALKYAFGKTLKEDKEKSEFYLRIQNGEITANVQNFIGNVLLGAETSLQTTLNGILRIANAPIGSQNVNDAIDEMSKPITLGNVTIARITDKVKTYKIGDSTFKEINGTMYEVSKFNGDLFSPTDMPDKENMKLVKTESDFNWSGSAFLTAKMGTDILLTTTTGNAINARLGSLATRVSNSKKIADVFGEGSQLAKVSSSFSKLAANADNATVTGWYVQMYNDSYIAAKEGGIKSEQGRHLYANMISWTQSWIQKINPDTNFLKTINTEQRAIVNALMKNDLAKATIGIQSFIKKAAQNTSKELLEENVQQVAQDFSNYITNLVANTDLKISDSDDYKDVFFGTVIPSIVASGMGGRVGNVNLGDRTADLTKLTRSELLTELALSKNGIKILEDFKNDTSFESLKNQSDDIISEVAQRKKYIDKIPEAENYSTQQINAAIPILQTIEKKQNLLRKDDGTFNEKLTAEIDELTSIVNQVLDTKKTKKYDLNAETGENLITENEEVTQSAPESEAVQTEKRTPEIQSEQIAPSTEGSVNQSKIQEIETKFDGKIVQDDNGKYNFIPNELVLTPQDNTERDNAVRELNGKTQATKTEAVAEKATVLPDATNLPIQEGFEEDYDKAQTIINGIDFNDEKSISQGISDIANLVAGKDVSKTKTTAEKYVAGKEKLLGVENYRSKEYLQKYIDAKMKDFSSIENNKNQNNEKEANNSQEVELNEQQLAETDQQSENTSGSTVETTIQNEEELIPNSETETLVPLQDAEVQGDNITDDGGTKSVASSTQQTEQSGQESSEAIPETPVSGRSEAETQVDSVKSAIKNIRVSDLTGDYNAETRRDLLQLITGTRPPKAKAGVNAVKKALYDFAGIKPDSEAGMEKALKEWANSKTESTQAVQEQAPQLEPNQYEQDGKVYTQDEAGDFYRDDAKGNSRKVTNPKTINSLNSLANERKEATVEKTMEKDGYTYKKYADGSEVIISPKGKQMTETTTRTVIRKGKKVTEKTSNANFRKAKARIFGEKTNNEIELEDKQRLAEAVANFTPTNEREAVLHYFASGGKIDKDYVSTAIAGNSESLEARGRKKRSINEYRWAWFTKKNNVPSGRRISEDLATGEFEAMGFDQQTLRNEVDDALLSYGNVSEIQDELVDLYNKSNDPYYGLSKKDQFEMWRNGLSQQENAMIDAVQAEEILTEDEKKTYYQQQYENSINSLTDEQQEQFYNSDTERANRTGNGRVSTEGENVSSSQEQDQNSERTGETETEGITEQASTQNRNNNLVTERVKPEKRTAKPTAKKISEIIADAAKSFGSTLIYGNSKGRGTIGTYNSSNTLIRIKRAGDIDTVAHEIGHFIDDKFNFLGNLDPSLKILLDRELKWFSDRGGSDPNPKFSAAKKLEYLQREGLAEFVRAYIVNPSAAKTLAPNLYSQFEAILDDKAKKALKDFSEDVITFANATEGDQIISQVENSQLPNKKGFLEFIKKGDKFGYSVFDDINTTVFDSMAKANKAFEFINKLKGDPEILPEKNFKLLHRVFAGVNGKIDDILTNGMTDGKNKRLLDSNGDKMTMEWLLSPLDSTSEKTVREDMDDVIKLLIAERTIEYAKKFGRLNNLTGIGGGMRSDFEVAQKYMNDFNDQKTTNKEKTDRITEAARRYREYADAGLKYAVDKGRLAESVYDKDGKLIGGYAFIKANNEFYVNLTRRKEIRPNEDIEADFGDSGSLTSVKDVFKKSKGGSETIRNPYESLLINTANIIKEADRNEVMASFIKPLKNLRAMGDGTPIDFAQIANPANDKDKNVKSFYIDGVKERWQFSPDLIEAFNSLDGMSKDGIIARSAQLPAKLIRFSVTKFPIFAVRNTTRDTVSRVIMSRTGSGFMDMIHKASDAELFSLYGGSMAGYYGNGKQAYIHHLNDAVKKISASGKGIVINPMTFVRGYNKFLEKSESVNRIAEFKSAFAKAKKEGMDDYNAGLYAAFEARDLMDFALSGVAVRELNKYIPFLNAGVQGLVRVKKQITTKPMAWAVKTAIYTILPTLVARAMVHSAGDDDDYKELPAYMRDLFWNFRTPFTGSNWISIPKPYENGLVSALVDRGISKIMGDDEAFDGLTGSLFKTLVPVDESSFLGSLKPIVENLTNYDFFRDTTIVSQWEEKKFKEKRKGDKHASRISQMMSDFLYEHGKYDVNPHKIDHLIKGYGTYLGDTALRIGDVGVEDSRFNFGVSQLGFAKQTPLSNAKTVGKVYELAEGLGESQKPGIKKLRKMIQHYYELDNSEAEIKQSRAIYKVAQDVYKDLKAKEKKLKKE